jgi:Kef-type K+ transport system membrane component KefB
MPELKLLFLQILVILLAAKILAAGFRLIRQPEVLGEMAAGILLGPSLLGKFAPELMNALFPVSSLGPLYALSQLGLVLFMFLVGLEVRLGLLRDSARSALLASLASIAGPFVCGAVMALRLYAYLGDGVARLPFVLFFGAAMSVTAFPVLARILADRKLMHTRPGVLAISCAAVGDVIAWCVLAVITVVARPEASRGGLPLRFAGLGIFVVVMVVVVRPWLRRVVPANAPLEISRFALAMIVLLASVWATEALAVHALFGAFVAGLMMPRGAVLEEGLRTRLESVTLVLLLPLFFGYNGLRTNISLLNDGRLWVVCVAIVLVAIASKLLVTAVSIRLSGITWRESFAVSVLVNTRGLVELVILNVGLDLHVLSPTLFSMMVIMALATTFMTAPLLDWIYPAAKAEAVALGSA